MSRGATPSTVRELLQEVGLLRRHEGPMRPGLYFVTRAHDATCRRPQGAPCTCLPDVSIEQFQRPRAHA
jgi:hypothetical protein